MFVNPSTNMKALIEENKKPVYELNVSSVPPTFSTVRDIPLAGQCRWTFFNTLQAFFLVSTLTTNLIAAIIIFKVPITTSRGTKNSLYFCVRCLNVMDILQVNLMENLRIRGVFAFCFTVIYNNCRFVFLIFRFFIATSTISGSRNFLVFLSKYSISFEAIFSKAIYFKEKAIFLVSLSKYSIFFNSEG